MKKNKKLKIILSVVVFILFVAVNLYRMSHEQPPEQTVHTPSTPDITEQEQTVHTSSTPDIREQEPDFIPFVSFGSDAVPEYSGSPFYVLNGNVPYFTEELMSDVPYETYSALDGLGRCGTTMACIGRELMPTDERESISSVTPSGWVNVPYDFVDGRYLYNRCHLIGFQLTGENANECNLVTGTRYMNVEGMLPFEDLVAEYVHDSGNHVLYRVTPIYEGSELVCRGVHMEGYSVEDKGASVCFNVFIYNVQPGVIIDYASGESAMDEAYFQNGEQMEYILNTSSKKFHTPDCSGAKNISEKNREDYTGTRQWLIALGYEACSQCNP